MSLRKQWLAGSVLAAGMLLCGGVSGADDAVVSQGRALFTGKEALTGRIVSHLADLPPEVVRCSNCHAVGEGPAVKRSNAPRLGRDLLSTLQRRRGGPASSYTEDMFCRVLRKGIDPSYVLISIEMPRYRINDAQCEALWRFVKGDGK